VLKYQESEKKEGFRALRTMWEGKLLLQGLILEQEGPNDRQETFVKVFAPFRVLGQEAEAKEIKLSLLSSDSQEMASHARFSLSKLSQFGGGDSLKPCRGYDPADQIADRFFSPSLRNLLTYYILARTVLSPAEVKEAEVRGIKVSQCLSINHMLAAGVYSAFFPIHEGPHEAPKGRVSNLRAWLKRNWTFKVASYQPLDSVREYFGEKIALYFAFLGFYTSFLWIPAAAGLLSFAYGLYFATSHASEEDTFEAIMGRVVDNPSTLPFAAFVCLWGTLFLDFWRRQSTFLAWKWGVLDYEKTEVTRPEWYGTKVRISPVTNKKEYYYPWHVQRAKMAASCCCISVAVMIVVLTVLCTLLYTIWASNYFGSCRFSELEEQACVNKNLTGVPSNFSCADPCFSLPDPSSCEALSIPVGSEGSPLPACLWLQDRGLCAPACPTFQNGVSCKFNPTSNKKVREACIWKDDYLLADITSSLLSLVSVLTLNEAFNFVAHMLNNWENHKTATIWEDALITKTFSFQFLNSYIHLFYIAFFKGTLAQFFFGYEDATDSCLYGSCFNELMFQLAIVFLGKQLIGQILEVGIPALKAKFKIKIQKEEDQKSLARCQWLMDDYLDPNDNVLFDDYNEMGFPLFLLLSQLIIWSTIRPFSQRFNLALLPFLFRPFPWLPSLHC